MNRKFKRTAFIKIEIFYNIRKVFSGTFHKFNALIKVQISLKKTLIWIWVCCWYYTMNMLMHLTGCDIQNTWPYCIYIVWYFINASVSQQWSEWVPSEWESSHKASWSLSKAQTRAEIHKQHCLQRHAIIWDILSQSLKRRRDQTTTFASGASLWVTAAAMFLLNPLTRWRSLEWIRDVGSGFEMNVCHWPPSVSEQHFSDSHPDPPSALAQSLHKHYINRQIQILMCSVHDGEMLRLLHIYCILLRPPPQRKIIFYSYFVLCPLYRTLGLGEIKWHE